MYIRPNNQFFRIKYAEWKFDPESAIIAFNKCELIRSLELEQANRIREKSCEHEQTRR